jgi:hypothetical protein
MSSARPRDRGLPVRAEGASVAGVLERVDRPVAEPERVDARPRTPLPPPFLAAGNAAVTRALLARNRKQWERDATSRGLQNDKERNLYIELRQNKFDDDQIDAAGAGTPNADLLAYDGARLWIVEVKGHTDWLSKDNQERRGNVPLKQIGNKLKGKLGKEIKVAKVEMTVGEALADPSTAGRREIGLTVTNLDTQGALLAVEMITDEEGKQEATPYATTINEVMRFFDDVLERYDGSSEDAAKPVNTHAAAARALLTTWRKGCDPDEFLEQNGPALERIYTQFRTVMAQTRQQFANFAKLDADLDVNVALLPVRKTLARVARRAVLARTRFKGAADAQRWLDAARENLPRQDEEDDDSWITRMLLADEEYGAGNDFTPNYQLLVKALGQPVQPPVQQRQAPKGRKQRTIDGKMWNHIINGVVTIEKVGAKKTPTEKVTGLHTIHGDHPAAEGFGNKTMVGPLGCYKQSVRAKHPEGEETTAESRDKKFQSTFYPDEWTLEDIREAIEYASQRGKEYEVMSPEKGIGMMLFFNGESYYPNYR